MQVATKFEEIGDFTDRRTHPRHETFWWGDVAIGAERRECYVYNVSLGGAKLLVIGSYDAQERLTLQLPSFGLFECSLRWVDGPFIGIKFDEADHARTAELVAHALRGLPIGELPSVADFIGL
jgi:hypothetical protein